MGSKHTKGAEILLARAAFDVEQGDKSARIVQMIPPRFGAVYRNFKTPVDYFNANGQPVLVPQAPGAGPTSEQIAAGQARAAGNADDTAETTVESEATAKAKADEEAAAARAQAEAERKEAAKVRAEAEAEAKKLLDAAKAEAKSVVDAAKAGDASPTPETPADDPKATKPKAPRKSSVRND